MAWSFSNLHAGTTGSGVASQATPSLTSAVGTLYFVAVNSLTSVSTDPNTPTVTGWSLTWTALPSALYDNSSTSRRRGTVFWAVGTAVTSGAITADFATQTQDTVTVFVDQATGENTASAIGSNSAANQATGGASSLTVTLASFASATNATYAVFFQDSTIATPTEGSGFTPLNTYNAAAKIGTFSEYKASSDTTADVSWSASPQCGGVAVEINEATSGAYTLTANAGAYTFTGVAATLTKSKLLTASAGSYAFTGIAATLTKSKLVAAVAGAYTFTGQAATLNKSKLVTANAGAYSFVGKDATLTKTTAGAYVLTANAGSYSFTGKSATFTYVPNVVVSTKQGGDDVPREEYWEKRKEKVKPDNLDNIVKAAYQKITQQQPIEAQELEKVIALTVQPQIQLSDTVSPMIEVIKALMAELEDQEDEELILMMLG